MKNGQKWECHKHELTRTTGAQSAITTPMLFLAANKKW